MNKWLDITNADSLGDAARQSLQSRLDAVRRCLRQAVKKPDQPQRFHQLRVWTRRADAALTAYENLLPAKRLQRLRQRLKRIRQAAGRVRDCDVFAESTLVVGDRWPKALSHERTKALQQLVALYVDLDRGRRLRRSVGRLLERVRSVSSRETFTAHALIQLRPMVAAFFTASPAPEACETELHQFRLQGKQLRYAMELFATAFPPRFRDELYPQLGEVQTMLGAINDWSVAQDRLELSLGETSSAAKLSDLRRRLADAGERMLQARAAFHSWWTRDLAADLQSCFDELMQTPNRMVETCNRDRSAA